MSGVKQFRDMEDWEIHDMFKVSPSSPKDEVLDPDMWPIRYAKDPVIEDLLNRVRTRANDGMVKFGISMEDEQKPTLKWIDDIIEELLDACAYLVKLRRILAKLTSDK